MAVPVASSSSPETDHAALVAAVAEMARVLAGTESVATTLSTVAHLAHTLVEGCDFAGVVLVGGDGDDAVVGSDPVVSGVDDLQRRSGQGPGLDVAGHGGTLYVEDLADEARWPRFAPAAAALGVRSVLVTALPTDRSLGTLYLYGSLPRAFGAVDRARALLLAGLTGLAVSSAVAHDSYEHRLVDLRTALATRELIGQAQGILIERERITANQAFDVLRRASQHLNIKLREVAQTLIDTGENPDTGAAPTP